MRTILTLPNNVTISGTVYIPCKGHYCSEFVKVKIEDEVLAGHGSGLDGIQNQVDDTEYRCDECRADYLRRMNEERYDDDFVD